MSEKPPVDSPFDGDPVVGGERDAPAQEDSGEWLTKEEAARHLGVSTKSIQRYVADGQLPVYRAGRSMRIRRADLEDFTPPSRPRRTEPLFDDAMPGARAGGQRAAGRLTQYERDLLELGRQAKTAGIRRIFRNRVADAAYKAEFDKALDDVPDGGSVKIMSNSLRFLLGPQPDMSLYIPMWDALKRDVTFDLLLLDPFSDAAHTRAGVEEREEFDRNGPRYYETHLYRDIIAVAETLAEPDLNFIRDAHLRERLKDRDQVRVRFSEADPTTHLVLTDELCLVENYHTGGDDEIKSHLEHMGIPDVYCFGGFITAFLYERSALTGSLLATHFEHSWQQAGSGPTVEDIIEQHEKLRGSHAD